MCAHEEPTFMCAKYGTGSNVLTSCPLQASLEELMEGGPSSLTVYDEAALCSSSFKSVEHIAL